MGALDELLLIIVPIIVFRISYGLARGRRPTTATRQAGSSAVRERAQRFRRWIRR